MIGKLTGKVDNISGNQLVVDVQCVGYVVAVSGSTLNQIGATETVSLLIETQVREDAISLFGFIDIAERDWFRLLTTVQGVGAKSALAILSILSPERLAQAVGAQDKAVLTPAEGVGPNLGLRIVTELKDKVAGFIGRTGLAATTAPIASSGISSDAVSALINLGYRRMEAFAAVSSAAGKLGSDVKLDALIRASLAELSRRDTAA